MPHEKYKSALAQHLDTQPENITLFWKGRVGLYGILEAMKIGPGDEVIIPAFTCVVVANAILYLGAKPVYAEIDPKTFNIDICKINQVISPRSKVIIAQNTFGLSSDLDGILEIAKKHQLRVIEDCTHGFGGTYKDKPNGSIAEAAFFSSQWNKTFSTGIGGMVVCNTPELATALNVFEKKCSKPSFLESRMLGLQMMARNQIQGGSAYWSAVKLYRYLSDKNIITGSSQGEELTEPKMPEDYLKKMSGVQARRGVKELKRLEENLRHRTKITNLYKEIFKKLKLNIPFEPKYAKHTYIKFPFFVKDRTAFLKKAEEEKIPVGDWFLSPIHPIETDFELWQYSYFLNPIAEKISRHILNLNTDFSIREKDVKHIESFLIKNKSELIAQLDFSREAGFLG